jgi:hypothetical protein
MDTLREHEQQRIACFEAFLYSKRRRRVISKVNAAFALPTTKKDSADRRLETYYKD